MAADGFHVLYHQGEERLKRMMKDRDFLEKAIQAVAPMCTDSDFIARVTDAAFNASQQVFLEQPVTMHEANWMDRLGQIRCPVLFLHGESDHFVPQDGSIRTASAIPNCTLKFLPQCGHSPMVEIFPEFYKEIFDFLGA
jgi:pimeloyl-ACP methyl ester carboxylesterase